MWIETARQDVKYALRSFRREPAIAIPESGGLAEVFTLPVLMILPGAVLGTVGGAAAVTVRVHQAARTRPTA